jgi:coenzyme F420-reducing hydrogenase beta subunit
MRTSTLSAPPCLARIGDDQCTGCAACANGCERRAIEIALSPEGFYRPVLRWELCDSCMECLGSCPVIALVDKARAVGESSDHVEAYAAWSNDEEIHLSSSSGGIFSELARQVLDNGGVVFGCEWGESWTPRHVAVSDWAEVPRLRGSKYVPSRIGERLYRDIIDLATRGTLVLFCGTPCQVAGLDLICPSEARHNLLLVDLVCHGVPSLTSFWGYLDWKFGSTENLAHFSFRSKDLSLREKGGFFYSLHAITKSGEESLFPAGLDPWFKAGMMFHLFLQRCCFECRFNDLPRCGDITLGDFWGIPGNWHDPRGDSVVLIHTERGRAILRQLEDQGRIRAKSAEYSVAAEKSGRLRGSTYPVPFLRKPALQWIAEGRSYGRIHSLIYLPLRWRERILAYRRSMTRRLVNPFQAIFGRC